MVDQLERSRKPVTSMEIVQEIYKVHTLVFHILIASGGSVPHVEWSYQLSWIHFYMPNLCQPDHDVDARPRVEFENSKKLGILCQFLI